MSLQYLLMANYFTYRRLLMKRLAGTGLTPGQPKVLDYLWTHDGSAQTEIAAANLLEPATLTVLLGGMEKKGLVERRRSEADRREVHVFLTPRGRESAAAVEDAFARLERRLTELMPGGAAPSETLRELLSAMRAMAAEAER